MARGRILNKKISYDEQVNAMIDQLGPWAGLFYSWLIAHLDKEGRTYASTAVLKGLVIPLRNEVTIELINDTLQLAHDLELLVLYPEKSDPKYVWFPKFRKNQPGLRQDREPESEIPAPPSRVVASWARKLNGGQGASKPNNRKGKGSRKGPETKDKREQERSGSDPAMIRQTSGSDPAEGRNVSGDDPAMIRPKRSKEKRREEKEREAKRSGPLSRAWEVVGELYPALAEDAKEIKATEKMLLDYHERYGSLIDLAECIEDAHHWEHHKRDPKKGPISNHRQYLRNWFKRAAGDDVQSRRERQERQEVDAAHMSRVELVPSDPNEHFKKLMEKAREQADE